MTGSGQCRQPLSVDRNGSHHTPAYGLPRRQSGRARDAVEKAAFVYGGVSVLDQNANSSSTMNEMSTQTSLMLQTLSLIGLESDVTR